MEQWKDGSFRGGDAKGAFHTNVASLKLRLGELRVLLWSP